jgi:hypothetical protein
VVAIGQLSGTEMGVKVRKWGSDGKGVTSGYTLTVGDGRNSIPIIGFLAP